MLFIRGVKVQGNLKRKGKFGELMGKNICGILNLYIEEILCTPIVFVFDMWLIVSDEVIRLDPMLK